MEDNDPKNDQRNSKTKRKPASSVVPKDSKAITAEPAKNKTTNRQKSKKRSPDRRQQIKFVLEVLAGIVGILGVAALIANYFQSERHFDVEHRPKLIFPTPPLVGLDTIQCDITENALHWASGPVQVIVRDIGSEDALSAFVTAPDLQFIPEKKTGLPFFDDLLVITDQTCARPISKAVKFFPIHKGETVTVNITRGAGVLNLIKTNQASVSLDGVQPEPVPVPVQGQNPERVRIGKDASFQLYGPVCVYYRDGRGRQFGTCSNYRFMPTGSDNGTLSCVQGNVSGKFEAVFANYCEN